MKYLYSILLSLFTFSHTHAAWTYATESVNGNIYFIDYASIKDKGEYRYAWIKAAFTKVLIQDKYRSAKQFLKVDCDLLKFKTEQYIVYEDIESSKQPLSFSIEEDFTYVAPDSTWHGVLSEICK